MHHYSLVADHIAIIFNVFNVLSEIATGDGLIIPLKLSFAFVAIQPYFRTLRGYRRDLNPQPSVCKADVLPVELLTQTVGVS